MLEDTQIETFVDEVQECWIRLGLDASARHRLTTLLREDLRDAKADLPSIESFVGRDVVAFAVELALADGHQFGVGRKRDRPGTVVPAVLVGAIFGSVVSWFVIYANYGLYDLLDQALPQFGVAIVLHTAAAVLVLGSVGVAAWSQLRYLPDAWRKSRRAVLFALVGGLASLAPAVWVARHSGYRWDMSVVMAETALVGGCMAIAVYLAHRPRSRPTLPQ